VSLFALLAVIKTKFPRRFQEFILLPITNKYFTVEGKSSEVTHPFSLLLFIVQALSFSLFICIVLSLNKGSIKNSPILFLQVFTGYTLIILAKYYIEKLVAHVFDIEKLVQDYLYGKLSYINLLSLIVLIANLIFYFIFLPDSSVINFVVILFVFLYVIALISSIKKNTTLILRNFLYFILYLCALEFAPYVILYKLVV
jgi:hypothetical protein